MPAELSELDRREVFLSIVKMQDDGVGLDNSRTRTADQFDIDTDSVREIESEGIAKKWPPL